MTDELRTLLAFARLPRLPRGSVKQLLAWTKSHGGPTASLRDAVAVIGLPAYTAAELDAALAKADQILTDCDKVGITIRPYGSPLYPTQLDRLSHPPTVLFTSGHLACELQPRVAVIGTRTPTPWGTRTAKTCAARIARAHGVVVSGLAIGIDTAAHAATVDAGGVTWAVLPSGLHAIPTSAQRTLAQRILESRGALISEYPPNEPAQRRYFVARDRIQAGLSDAVLIVESELGGGAMHTVRFARAAGVPVWATLPGGKTRAARDAGLCDVQRGPSELLRWGTAIRIASASQLDRMVRGLGAASRRACFTTGS